MWFSFNLMLDWRAMTVTVHLAPWSEGHSLSVQRYDLKIWFFFTQYSFCNSFRHCLLDRPVSFHIGRPLKYISRYIIGPKMTCLWGPDISRYIVNIFLTDVGPHVVALCPPISEDIQSIFARSSPVFGHLFLQVFSLKQFLFLKVVS